MLFSKQISGVPDKYIFNVQEAANWINKHLDDIYRIISTHNEPFDFAKKDNGQPVNGADVVIMFKAYLERRKHPIRIKAKHGGWLSKWYAQVYNHDPDTVWLNLKYINRSQHSLINTLIHEACHCVDGYVDDYIGHQSNTAKGKQNSAPYWIGRAVGDEARDDQKPKEPGKQNKVYVCSGWWIFKRCKWVDKKAL